MSFMTAVRAVSCWVCFFMGAAWASMGAEGRKALWVRAPFGAPRAYLVKSLFQPTRAA